MKRELIDRAAQALREDTRAFSRRNLYHATLRLGGAAGYERFVRQALRARLAAGPIEGLLPPWRRPPPRRLGREWLAYAPAAILIVDRPELVDLFAASGVIVQARIAVVSLDGSPATVLRWLCAGIRRGFRPPVGYLHDAATIAYPFAREPLRAYLAALRPGERLPYRDLGLPVEGLAPRALPFSRGLRGPLFEVEAPPPHAMIAYAARQLLALLPRDPWLAPIAEGRPR